MPATIVLGGLTYAMLHFFEAWTSFRTPAGAIVSVSLLVLQYAGPGMVKSLLRLRTGNAWVHVWAYHAVAPHTLVDTPHVVEILGVRQVSRRRRATSGPVATSAATRNPRA